MRHLLQLFLLLWVLVANAQQELEIIELRRVNVEQVLPALRPLLEPGATLSGMNNQLFLRASARNRADIRKALAALDHSPRQLLLTISRQQGSDEGRNGATLTPGTQRGGQAAVWDTRSVRADRAAQTVRAQDGSPAFVQVGQSLAIPMRQIVLTPDGALIRESIQYRDIGQGFYAVPHVSGDQVSIEIALQADQLGFTGRPNIRTERLSTALAGHLGEWLLLGGGQTERGGRSDNEGVASTREVRGQGSLWLKVEAAD